MKKYLLLDIVSCGVNLIYGLNLPHISFDQQYTNNAYIRLARRTSLALIPFSIGILTILHTPFKSHDNNKTYMIYAIAYISLILTGEYIQRKTKYKYCSELLQISGIVGLACIIMMYHMKIDSLDRTIARITENKIKKT